MKQTIIQCVTALLCVIAIAVTSVISVTKISDAKIEAAKNTATAVVATPDNGEAPADPSVSDDTTPADEVPADDTSVADDTVATDDTATADDTATDAGTVTATDAKATNATKATASAPSTKADIAKYYNTALNKVISSKAGYTKSRTTNLSKLEGAEAIMKIKIAADAVNDFLGVGTTKYVNKKGQAKYLSTASLTAADITSATCTGTGTYTITINLANGSSTSPTVADNSPLKRSGLLVGNDDNTELDYKNANNIYIGLNNADNASVKSVKETTSNAKIIATVDAATGNMKSLKVTFDWQAALTDVKYTVIKISGTGIADTTVSISAFQF